MDNRNQFQKWFDADEKVATGVILAGDAQVTDSL
jgi:hypothetical protein